MNLLVVLVNKPCSRARISNYNIKRLYVYAAAATPNNCTKEYAIDVFITKVNTIEDQYACDSYSLQQ
jgi:hypothetical protein